jgi:hypothetical protein
VPFITGGSSGGGGGAISGVTVTGTAALGQAPIASSSSAGTWAYPPGFEFDYAQATANVNVVNATPVTFITGNAVTYDGATRVKLEVVAPFVSVNASNGSCDLRLYEGATHVVTMTELYYSAGTLQVNTPAYGAFFFTPAAGAHTYLIKVLLATGAGTATAGAGAGTAGTFTPAYMRITKA